MTSRVVPVPVSTSSTDTEITMTDLERYVQMLKDFNIKYEVVEVVNPKAWTKFPSAKSLVTSFNNGIGYSDFISEFLFDEEGKYLASGYYE